MSSTTTVKLSGLTCEACEKISSKKLSKIAGVENVTPMGDKSTFVITANRDIPEAEIIQSLEETGYKVVQIIY